jgi:hypothetical protein
MQIASRADRPPTLSGEIMRNRGPLVTLFGALGLALVLLFVNMAKEDHKPTAQKPASSSVTTVTAPAPVTTVTAPAPTTTVTVPSPSRPATPPVRFPAKATYVGWTNGREASVAIAVQGNVAVAYICDNQALEAWLAGSAVDGKLNLKGKNTARLTGALKGKRVTGTVWAGGKRWQFSTDLVGPPAGLYQASATIAGVQTRVSWIVQQNNQQSGLASAASATNGGSSSPAPKLNTTTGKAVVDGTTVTAHAVDGSDVPSGS